MALKGHRVVDLSCMALEKTTPAHLHTTINWRVSYSKHFPYRSSMSLSLGAEFKRGCSPGQMGTSSLLLRTNTGLHVPLIQMHAASGDVAASPDWLLLPVLPRTTDLFFVAFTQKWSILAELKREAL